MRALVHPLVEVSMFLPMPRQQIEATYLLKLTILLRIHTAMKNGSNQSTVVRICCPNHQKNHHFAEAPNISFILPRIVPMAGESIGAIQAELIVIEESHLLPKIDVCFLKQPGATLTLFRRRRRFIANANFSLPHSRYSSFWGICWTLLTSAGKSHAFSFFSAVFSPFEAFKLQPSTEYTTD